MKEVTILVNPTYLKAAASLESQTEALVKLFLHLPKYLFSNIFFFFKLI